MKQLENQIKSTFRASKENSNNMQQKQKEKEKDKKLVPDIVAETMWPTKGTYKTRDMNLLNCA